jgi:ABC-type phosphate/phosphonate transport system ATPase subunit
MIELLGVGVPDGNAGWLLHRVCARWSHGEVAAVVSDSAAQRLALIDTVAGRRIPIEGRAWLDGVALAPDTAARVRAHVGDVDLGVEFVERRSLLWNTLAGERPGLLALAGLVRFPREREREAAMRALRAVQLDGLASETVARLDREERARLALARALRRGPRRLVLREVDVAVGVPDAERVLDLVRRLVRTDRLSAAVSLASLSLARQFADRIAVLVDALLVLDAAPSAFTEDEVAWRLGRDGRPRSGRY